MAITKTKIQKTLNDMDKFYNQTTDPNLQKYYSKLALLELCGWIEQAIDEIVLRCAKRCIKNPDYLKVIQDDVKKTSNFDYEKSFRDLLIKIIGLMNFEKLEKSVNPVSLAILKPKLNSLKPLRNSHAHTHIENCTQILNSPSVTKGYFIDIFNALKDYEQTLKRLGL
ncbi:MAG: endoribonuclease [Nostocales cyanobacterium]|nr:MAG: endoribonuclease [Nostocales cyanobacterium]TAF15209.1 MAG: endoribonuclease [Nostocales cyanobacterium]